MMESPSALDNSKTTLQLRIIYIVFFAITSWLVLNIFLWNDVVEYACKQTLDISARVILGMDLFLLVLLVLLGIKFIDKNGFPHKYFLFLNFAILFLQILFAYNIYFFTGWDAGRIFEAVHHIINQGGFRRINAIYPFSIYPNNLGILFVLSSIEWTSRLFKVDGYLVSMVLSVLSVNLAGLVVYYTVKHITQKTTISLFTWILFYLLFGFSPWITIPYTDNFSILFPIAVIYIYITKKSQLLSLRRSLLIGFLLFLGMYIKPTVAIVLAAIILTESLNWGKKNENFAIYRKLLPVGFIILGGVPAILGNAIFHKALANNINSEARFTALHYVNMGLNNDSDGVYSSEDIDYSTSFPSVRERNLGNLASIKERLVNFGFGGYMNFLSRKALVNFADGSFAWGMEGNFFLKIPERTSAFSKIINSYIIKNGTHYSKFITANQFAWYLSLLILPFLIFVPGRFNKNDIFLLCVSILGIVAFVMLFEARARYLINFIPVFLVGVGIGYNNLIAIAMDFYKKIKKQGTF